MLYLNFDLIFELKQIVTVFNLTFKEINLCDLLHHKLEQY